MSQLYNALPGPYRAQRSGLRPRCPLPGCPFLLTVVPHGADNPLGIRWGPAGSCTPLPGPAARGDHGQVIISLLTYRRFDTRAEVVVNAWTVAGGSVNLLRRTWDPQGPMSSREAAVAALKVALAALEGPTPADAREG